MSTSEISINLQFPTAEFRARDRQNIRFTLTNNSNETINVLKWNTPFEGINNDLFRIEKDGKRAIYLGKMVKRRAPRPEDYITIEPRGSVSSDVALTEYYDISEPGQYDVRYRLTILGIGRESPQILARRFLEEPSLPIHRIQSNVVRFALLEPREPKQINGISVEWLAEHPDITAFQPPSFSECTTAEQTDLENALREAEKISGVSKLALSHTPEDKRPEAKRYKEWFGEHDTDRYDKVTENFAKICYALTNATIRFMCDCSTNDFAYVFPTKPYEIHLCNSFWTAPLTGTDSRAGTIVHEISHFDVVAATDDNAYGHANCKQLAIDDPAEAIANADSHEYFAENDPHLTMPYTLSLDNFLGQKNIARPVRIRDLAQTHGLQPPFSIFILLYKLALIIVPDVRQTFARDAADVVISAGLVPEFSGPNNTNSWVFSQSPFPGRLVLRGSTVRMVLRDEPLL